MPPSVLGSSGGGLLRSPSYEGGIVSGNLVSAGPVGGFIGQSASYRAPTTVGVIGGGVVNAGYTPGIVKAGYTPGMVNAGYTPGIVNAGYTPGIVNAGYTPSIVNAGYTGSQRRVRLEEYDLDQFDALEKNELVSIFTDGVLQTMRSSPMAANEVWVTLEKGPLIFVTSIPDPSGNEVWPTEEDARDTVEAVLRQRNNAKSHKPQNPQTNCGDNGGNNSAFGDGSNNGVANAGSGGGCGAAGHNGAGGGGGGGYNGGGGGFNGDPNGGFGGGGNNGDPNAGFGGGGYNGGNNAGFGGGGYNGGNNAGFGGGGNNGIPNGGFGGGGNNGDPNAGFGGGGYNGGNNAGFGGGGYNGGNNAGFGGGGNNAGFGGAGYNGGNNAGNNAGFGGGGFNGGNNAGFGGGGYNGGNNAGFGGGGYNGGNNAGFGGGGYNGGNNAGFGGGGDNGVANACNNAGFGGGGNNGVAHNAGFGCGGYNVAANTGFGGGGTNTGFGDGIVNAGNEANSRVSRRARGLAGAGATAAPKSSQEDIWAKANPSKWSFKEVHCHNYCWTHKDNLPVKQHLTTPIPDAKQWLKQNNPEENEAVYYQTNQKDQPTNQVTVFKRTSPSMVFASSEPGPFTFCSAVYQPLQSMHVGPDQNYLCLQQYKGNGNRTNPLPPLLCPGRGQGVADVPGLCLMRHVRPNDVNQGTVGDCWLLSGISALAEYPGAIRRLFRRTSNLGDLADVGQNSYTVTLYDLTTWSPVDVTVNEGLCQRVPDKNGSGGLLGAKPSDDGELWVCYLEKAIAAHCGGWDNINGGDCNHAWRLLTGCQDQYQIWADPRGGGFQCHSSHDANAQMQNSPHACPNLWWPSDWPAVGGGGSSALGARGLFERMCEWEDAHFLMGALTKSGSDQQSTDGIVDGHAYTILECHCCYAHDGSEIDLIKVRNPWGHGEYTSVSDLWKDNGEGWKRYPEVKNQCQPVNDPDDGQFWLTAEDFFQHFPTICLCAHDMSRFVAGNR